MGVERRAERAYLMASLTERPDPAEHSQWSIALGLDATSFNPDDVAVEALLQAVRSSLLLLCREPAS